MPYSALLADILFAVVAAQLSLYQHADVLAFSRLKVVLLILSPAK